MLNRAQTSSVSARNNEKIEVVAEEDGCGKTGRGSALAGQSLEVFGKKLCGRASVSKGKEYIVDVSYDGECFRSVNFTCLTVLQGAGCMTMEVRTNFTYSCF